VLFRFGMVRVGLDLSPPVSGQGLLVSKNLPGESLSPPRAKNA